MNGHANIVVLNNQYRNLLKNSYSKMIVSLKSLYKVLTFSKYIAINTNEVVIVINIFYLTNLKIIYIPHMY